MPYKDSEKERAYQRSRTKVRVYTPAQRKAKTAYNKKWKSHRKKFGRADGSWRIKATRPCPDACEVCGSPPPAHRRLDFDHCHTRNVFRGWLCNPCNMALGNAKDDPVRLRQLATYIENFELLS